MSDMYRNLTMLDSTDFCVSFKKENFGDVKRDFNCLSTSSGSLMSSPDTSMCSQGSLTPAPAPPDTSLCSQGSLTPAPAPPDNSLCSQGSLTPAPSPEGSLQAIQGYINGFNPYNEDRATKFPGQDNIHVNYASEVLRGEQENRGVDHTGQSFLADLFSDGQNLSRTVTERCTAVMSTPTQIHNTATSHMKAAPIVWNCNVNPSNRIGMNGAHGRVMNPAFPNTMPLHNQRDKQLPLNPNITAFHNVQRAQPPIQIYSRLSQETPIQIKEFNHISPWQQTYLPPWNIQAPLPPTSLQDTPPPTPPISPRPQQRTTPKMVEYLIPRQDLPLADCITCQWVDPVTQLECGLSFNTMQSIVDHISGIHLENLGNDRQDQFICYWKGCERSQAPWGAKYKLVSHIRVHTGEKPFMCPWPGCCRVFTRTENLKVHKRVHTGERPFRCKVGSCEKAFANSSDYKKHVLSHDKRLRYNCKVPGCEKIYTHPTSLRKHLKTVHPDIDPKSLRIENNGKLYAPLH